MSFWQRLFGSKRGAAAAKPEEEDVAWLADAVVAFLKVGDGSARTR